MGSDLQLELYSCACLTTPLRSCVICFHNVNEELWAEWEDRKSCQSYSPSSG